MFATFNRRASLDRLAPVIEAFEDGLVIETGERVPSREYVRWMREVPGLARGGRTAGHVRRRPTAPQEPALVASAVEFLLEGLHLQRRLNKDRGATGVTYRR